MTTKTDEASRASEEYAERPMCECAHASPDGVGLACEDVAEFEVTLLYPERRRRELYLLCRSCKADWVRNVPQTHRLILRKLGASGIAW